jgi:N4-(beta-N-acetylglucosaminyl)-L-asparaginase
MSNRRKFIKGGILGAIGTAIFPRIISAKKGKQNSNSKSGFPIVISTWEHGIAANKAAMKILVDGGRAIDAVESGVRVSEADPEIMSVGFGGLPDREGKVTLDACIMDETGNCGAVSFLQHIKHPISVARKIMDETPHVMLSGIGALQFALEKGFIKENLLTSKAKKKWQDWLKESEYKPIINVENHDTIGLLALDKKGNISGACTTSGLSWKMHGRVGDSPIIGAGMYVDNEVGGCCATGLGEAVMKTLGSFLIVELMRQGATPQEACEEAIGHIIKNQNYKHMQIGYIAINKKGNHGSFAVHNGFNYALHQGGKNQMIDSPSFVKK